MNFFLGKGDIDAGIGGDMPTLTAAANFDIVIPVMIQRGFVSIVANRHMLIDQLKRKKIGYAFGSNAHYALLKTLASAGLNENDVKLIPMEVAQMPEALDAGEITAFSAWEPTPYNCIKKVCQQYYYSSTAFIGISLFFKNVVSKTP
ncbi:MAG: ABC transporter substrate-binding protein [Desulfobacterium sp.]